MHFSKHMLFALCSLSATISLGMEKGTKQLSLPKVAGRSDVEQLRLRVTPDNVHGVGPDSKNLLACCIAGVMRGGIPNDRFKEACSILVEKGAELNKKIEGRSCTPFAVAAAGSITTGILEPALITWQLGGDPFTKGLMGDGSVFQNLLVTVKKDPNPREAKNAYKLLRHFQTKSPSLAHAVAVCNVSDIERLATPVALKVVDEYNNVPAEYLLWSGHMAKKEVLKRAVAALRLRGFNPNADIPGLSLPITFMAAATTKSTESGSLKLLKALIENGGGLADGVNGNFFLAVSPYKIAKMTALSASDLSPANAVYRLLKDHHKKQPKNTSTGHPQSQGPKRIVEMFLLLNILAATRGNPSEGPSNCTQQ